MRHHARFLLFASLAAALFLTGFTPPQQDITDLISLSVSAGYEGFLRGNQWAPLRVSVSNNGDDVEGRLVVRPERSENAVTNTYSVPISLPAGARKTAFLYITARSSATQLLVELIDNAGEIVQERATNVRVVQPQDQLVVVVTQAAGGSVDLTGASVGNSQAFQANWDVANIPDRAAALSAVNLLLLSDVDSGTLSPTQREALAAWVAQGGHLAATGGANWQATAAGVADLLPFVPGGSDSIEDIAALRGWSSSPAPLPDVPTIITTGEALAGAQVLLRTVSGLPLLIRRTYGAGTVDYLTVDPHAQPLRDWSGLPDFWLTLAATRDPQPSWAQGFIDWDKAALATEILPGFSLLPNVLPLFGFLAGYIVLVGPANYVVLNRLNRREFAWVTIPFFIVVFSVLAWVVGFNLRGNQVTLNRLTVVETWPDVTRARADEIIGLLSPRRAQYSLTLEDGGLLRPIPRSVQTGLLAGNVRASANVQQTDVFSVTDFPVDASFIAGFNASATIDRPDIGGRVTLFYDDEAGFPAVRGSVRNNTAQTVTDPVILARGVTLRLNEPLAAGDIAAFDLLLANREEPPAPAPIEAAPLLAGFGLDFRFRLNQTAEQTVVDILGVPNFDRRAYERVVNSAEDGQRSRQRQLFLSSFLNDRYASTMRGDRVYLAGWTDESPLKITLDGAGWETRDSTLYLIELEIEPEPPAGDVLITADRFTWMTRAREGGLAQISPLNLMLDSNEMVVFRFTPYANAVLAVVDELTLRFDRATNRTIPVDLWDWAAGDWEQIRVESGTHIIRSPQRFLGPQNAVELRLSSDEVGGFLRLDRIAIEQRGRF